MLLVGGGRFWFVCVYCMVCMEELWLPGEEGRGQFDSENRALCSVVTSYPPMIFMDYTSSAARTTVFDHTKSYFAPAGGSDDRNKVGTFCTATK